MESQPITALLTELKIDYRISGDEAIARCPSHDDRHPSWSCNIRTGVHHCFSCGFGGSLASLAARVLRLNYVEAVVWVNERVGWARAHKWREDIQNNNFTPAYLKLDEAGLALFTDPPEDALADRKLSLQSAKAYGLLWNPQSDSWIIPIRDPSNNDLWGWQEKNDRRFRNFPAGIRKSRSLFGAGTIAHGCPVILVESPLDAVRLHASGRSGAVSSYGVQVSDVQRDIISSKTELVILALDNDSAGISETARLCREFKAVSRVRVLVYSTVTGHKDPGEMSDEELTWSLAHSVNSIKWLRTYDYLHREFASVSDLARREVLIKEELTSSLLYGSW